MGRNIGVVGLGVMGRGMARSLLRKGHAVKLFNRTRAKADEVATSGGQVVATPADAARGSDVVVTMLADPAAILDVFEGPQGILSSVQPGTVVIDSSTISPPTTVRIAGKLKAKGAHLLDAPVFGSKNEAEKGELGFMVGGDRNVFEGAQDVFSAMGKSCRYMGASGMGVYAKLVFNLIVATTLEAWNEGMALATKAGINPQLMHDTLMSGRAKAGIIEMKGPNVLKGDFTPFFHLRLMHKDLELALETAHALSVPMPAVSAAKQVFTACMGAGQGEEDFSTTIKYYERLLGIQVRS
jgi:3-hydroxyisobutyrate dehydrogenase-like beta-hydroxyacid dehydrogenase